MKTPEQALTVTVTWTTTTVERFREPIELSGETAAAVRAAVARGLTPMAALREVLDDVEGDHLVDEETDVVQTDYAVTDREMLNAALPDAPGGGPAEAAH